MAEYITREQMAKHKPGMEYCNPPSEDDKPTVQVGNSHYIQQGNSHYVVSSKASPQNQMLYSQPKDMQQNQGGTQISSLDDITTPDTNGSASCVILRGVVGYAAFLNGTYQFVENVTHEKRPVYRLTCSVPYSSSSVTADHLYLYYKKKQAAWAIGLKVGSSGVLAYRKVQGINPVEGEGFWKITNTDGRFEENVHAKATLGIGVSVTVEDSELEADSSPAPPNSLPKNVSRRKLEKKLLAAGAKGHPIGTFVVRPSTSLPNTFVLSALSENQTISHVRVEYQNSEYTLGPWAKATFEELLAAMRDEEIRLADGTVFPSLKAQLGIEILDF